MKLFQVLVALDQLANTLVGGYADETLSARAFRTNHWLEYYINLIFFWEPQHCMNSYMAEVRKYQYPQHYRKLKIL